jgi:hypothetical protein
MAKMQVTWTINIVEHYKAEIDTDDIPEAEYEGQDLESRVLELLPGLESRDNLKNAYVEERDVDSLN